MDIVIDAPKEAMTNGLRKVAELLLYGEMKK
jgi:hypothetical protein